MKREFLQSFQVGDQSLPKEIIDAIMAENGRDIQSAKQAGEEWQVKYNQAVQEHQQQMQTLAFHAVLQEAVSAAGGRNLRAITALLDVDTLKQSEDQRAAVEQALAALKKDADYLFRTETPPPYARGTGAGAGTTQQYPTTLAGALREKYEKSKI